MDVIKFYNGMRDTTQGLPEWTTLHPQHQHMVLNAVNLLLGVMYDNNVQGKESENET